VNLFPIKVLGGIARQGSSTEVVLTIEATMHSQ
jgi:hypothetical protein